MTIDPTIDIRKSLSKVDDKDEYADLARQSITEYTIDWKNQKPKKDKQGSMLKLYNNQKRDNSKVGDTTMFTIHQTVLASLYVDRLSVEFDGREEGDEDVGLNLTSMAEYDYTDMEKDRLDYDWDWDTAFFGRGLVSLEEYIRDPKKGIYLPVPHNLDPIPFVRDPFASSVNGDRTGKGSAKNMGYEMGMTKEEIESNPNMFDDINFKDISFNYGAQSILQDAISAREEAGGFQATKGFEMQENLGANAEYAITIWYTHYRHEGKVRKVKAWLANDRSKVIGMQVIKGEKWPIIDRALYPHSNDWDGTSIPDLTEDKQRARAVAQNLGLDAMKADLYPMYIYDSKKITNRNDLNFGYNKFLPVDPKGESIRGAIEPVNKAKFSMGLLDFIYTSLDASAQKATATPEIQQGALSSKDRTLGELNMVSSNVDTRYSLSAKLFSMSEKKFWLRWYQVYKDNFADEIDEKVIRIVGAFGNKWRPLKKKDLMGRLDPDVTVESEVLSRAKQLEERNALTSYFTLAFQDGTSNRRYGLKKLGRAYGLKKDEVERLLPPTIDERIAEKQNDLLNDNKFAPVLAEDDHNVHLEIHSKANETDATKAHRETHEKALSIKKVNPEFFPEEPEVTDFQQTGGNNLPVLGAGGAVAPRQAPTQA